jgi:hypothetical protein
VILTATAKSAFSLFGDGEAVLCLGGLTHEAAIEAPEGRQRVDRLPAAPTYKQMVDLLPRLSVDSLTSPMPDSGSAAGM